MTTPWSHSARRSRAPHGEGACGDCMARGALRSIKTGRRELGISARDVDDIIKEPAFGAAWSVIEDRSPLFARRLLRPAELPEQIAIARRSLARLREGGSGARQHVQAKFEHIDPRARRRRSVPFVR